MDLLETYISQRNPADETAQNPTHLQTKCDALLSGDMTKREAQTRLMVAYHLIRQNPGCAAPQIVAALLLQRAGVTHHMLETWAALRARFPQNREIMGNFLNWLARANREEEAATLIEEFFAGAEMTLENQAEKADFFAKLRDFSRSDALFRDLIDRDRNNPLPRVVFGKTLFARGDILGAFSVLDPIRRTTTSKEAREIIKQTDRAIIAMETISPRSSRGKLTAPLALRNALSLFTKRIPRAVDSGNFGPIVFACGVLGESDADQRVVRLASRLSSERSINSATLANPVEILCTGEVTTGPWPGFRQAFQNMGQQIQQLDAFEGLPTGTPPQGAELLSDLMTLLPRSSRRGIERLVPHFQKTKPDLVTIWSEDAILPFALAALVAEVPRLVINLRALPPSSTSPENQPRYRALYNALLKVPGVRFTTQSALHATRYAEWLNIDPSLFTVLPEPTFADVEGFARDENLIWKSFEIATTGAEKTLAVYAAQIGPKDGPDWTTLISQALARHAGLRIVLMAPQNVATELRKQAKTLGLGARLLVVGETSATAGWLARADLFATFDADQKAGYHTAQAQTYGLPVITHTQPQMLELYDDGVTGFTLSDVTQSGPFQSALDRFLDSKPRYKLMSTRAKELAERRYSIDQISADLIFIALGGTSQQTTADKTEAPFLMRPQRPVPRPGAVSEVYRIVSQTDDAGERSSA